MTDIDTGSTPTSTRAAVINAYGGPDQLVLQEVPLSAPSASQVVVAVRAAAVNPVDLTTRAGINIPQSDARFPMVLGWDVAGTVQALGSSVTNLHVGDRVAAMVFQPIDQRGTYAAHVTLDAALLAPVPDALSLEQAATVPLAGLTASQLLERVRADGARTLFVTGPLGAVGRGVVALAANDGLEVVGAVSAGGAESLRGLGGTLAVGRDEFAAEVRERYPHGVDAAIDLVGGASARAAFDLVKDGGRYATSVPPYIEPSGRFEADRGIDLHVLTVQPDAGRLGELLELAAHGVLRTTIEGTFALVDAAKAHARQATGGLAGRVLLLP